MLALTMTCLLKAEVVYRDANVRFTLISDGAIRMEYAPDGKFVDDNSFMAVERDFPAVPAKVNTKGNRVTIATDLMELSYKKGSGPFTRNNLSIKSKIKDKPFTWRPGDKQNANLKGTYRTLDRFDGEYRDDERMPIEDGILARDGWTLLDDSSTLLFDGADRPWVKERKSSPEAQDWYFMAYGNDYKRALKDYTLFAGKVPLPPRYAFGYWWSRYWTYTDNELRKLVKDFKSYDIPLDVLVIDMDWHYTEKGKGGWTGYTWNRSLFPDPAGMLKFIKDNDLKITMNLHPADGIAPYEEGYSDMARSMGLNPADSVTIPFEASSQRFMDGWMKTILHPMEKDGVDFWWLDWQQFPNDRKIPSLSNTWWLNYAFFTDMERNRDTRPMLYHRWGGLGNHRYQIGFSGDHAITWASLDFQPYFNSTASNVLYGYWSHDIGGHHEGIGRIEPEMFVRWMQFGIFSPILRTHSTKNEHLKKEPWSFDKEHFNIIRDLIVKRYEMSPYIYTMARKTYDEGLSLCRPMYYDYPDAQEAYDFRNEYMFGDRILVMPVTAPMKGMYSETDIWLPEGDWYEWHSGTMLKGDTTVTRQFALDEYPVYIKAGSVIPMTEGVKNLRGNNYPYIINVFPGGDGEFTIYEDNGNDKNYADNFATTKVTSHVDGNKLTVTLSPRTGKYDDMPATRRISLKIHGYRPPESVTLDGKAIASTYDGNDLTLNIPVGDISCDREKSVTITYGDNMAVAPGTIAKFRRIYKALSDIKNNNAGILIKEPLAMLESAGRAITYHPEKFDEIMDRFNTDYNRLPAILNDHDIDDALRTRFLETVAWHE